MEACTGIKLKHVFAHKQQQKPGSSEPGFSFTYMIIAISVPPPVLLFA